MYVRIYVCVCVCVCIYIYIQDGETPIYAAACCGKTDAVKELIAAGCDMNLADKVKQMTRLALCVSSLTNVYILLLYNCNTSRTIPNFVCVFLCVCVCVCVQYIYIYIYICRGPHEALSYSCMRP